MSYEPRVCPACSGNCCPACHESGVEGALGMAGNFQVARHGETIALFDEEWERLFVEFPAACLSSEEHAMTIAAVIERAFKKGVSDGEADGKRSKMVEIRRALGLYPYGDLSPHRSDS